MSKTKTRRNSGLSITLAVILVCAALTALTWNLPGKDTPTPSETSGSSEPTPSPAADTAVSAGTGAPDSTAAPTEHTPSSEDPLLILVNRDNPLPEDYSITTVELKDFPQSIAAVAYEDLCAMLAAGRAEGLAFMVCSGYRTADEQAALFGEDMEIHLEQGLSYVDAYEQTALYTMPPGCSEHETGLAVDIVAQDQQMLDETQELTAETQWLHEHCWEYGFILRYPADRSEITGISYESWHYRYVGREAAAYLTEHGLTLEEFHASEGTS